MGILADDLGAKIKAELEERGTPLEVEEPDTPEDGQEVADKSDEAEKVEAGAEGSETEGKEEKPEPGEDKEIDGSEKFEDNDPALDNVLEFGGQKATLRELFEAHKTRFDPGHLNELVQGIEQDRRQYQEAVESLGELAEVRKLPDQFYIQAMLQDEQAGILPEGSAKAFHAWLGEMAQAGAINPAKWHQEAMQERHARALADKESEWAQKVTTMEAQADMTAIMAKHGRLSEQDTATLRAEITAKFAKGEDKGDHLVLRTFQDLLKSGRIKAQAKASPSPLKVADRIRRTSTGPKPTPNKKPVEMTRDEMEAGLARALRGV